MRRRRLILFTRCPEPGKVKTRLIPLLGEQGAASLQKQMTEHAVKWASALRGRDRGRLEIRFDGGTVEQMEKWLGPEHDYVPQGPGDLGERMARSFDEGFQGRDSRVVLVGTDVPQLTASHVAMAFDALGTHDVVIVPTVDGGYCLLGLRSMVPELFRSMGWGSETVFRTTLERARERGLLVRIFQPLHDIDTPGDLSVWEKVAHQFISIVIPTLNEADNLPRALESIGELLPGEVIVVDAGSDDDTSRIAEDGGAKVVSSEPNRGRQMNLGASEASGDILLFLHADTLLPGDYATRVRRALSDPLVVGGSFRWEVQPSGPFLKWIELTVDWRTRFLRLPYGDQAIFVRDSLFRELGGFSDIPLMEDVDFVRRLKKRGRLAYVRAPVVTSARRYEKLGPFRTTMKNKLIFFGYYLGIPPSRLARQYYKSSETDKAVP